MDFFREFFGILTILLAALANFPLIVQNVRGKLKSHPVTWAVATLTSGIQGVILLFNDAGPGTYGPLFAAFCSLILTIVSYHNYRKSDHITRRDIIFFLLAIIALILWLISRDLAALSVILLATATALSFVPTLTKTWRQPRSESYYTWVLFLLMAFFGIAATAHWDFVNLFQRMVNVFLNIAVILIMVFQRKKTARPITSQD